MARPGAVGVNPLLMISSTSTEVADASLNLGTALMPPMVNAQTEIPQFTGAYILDGALILTNPPQTPPMFSANQIYHPTTTRSSIETSIRTPRIGSARSTRPGTAGCIRPDADSLTRIFRARPVAAARSRQTRCSILKSVSTTSASSSAHMRQLVDSLHDLEDRLRQGGGSKKIEKQHRDGKLTARERIDQLIDPGAMFLEIGLLIAYDQYDGQAPSAGVVTGIGKIEGRPAVIVANDATVKAGAWWPETITKILRAQEIAMRNRTPIVYLVDSAGVNLPYQDGIFPGQYGAARIFYYNCLMRRKLHVPQIAAVMGPCIAGGAYLPALSDVIFMVDGTSFMGLGGPNLVKGAVGQVVDAESLGGARMHTQSSGVAHFMAKDDAALSRTHSPEIPRHARSAQAAAGRRASQARRRSLRPDAFRSPARLQHGGRHRAHL